MNEMGVTVYEFRVESFPDAPFKSTREYLEYQSNKNLIHLHAQRNLANDRDDAKRRYISRHRFRQLIQKYCMDKYDHGPFKAFLRRPAAFEHTCQSRNVEEQWNTRLGVHPCYACTIFLRPPLVAHIKRPRLLAGTLYHEGILDTVRAQTGAVPEGPGKSGSKREPRPGVRLSGRMRESWESKRFWFDYGIRKSMDVDVIYWDALHEEGDDVLADEKQRKMQDVKAYDTDCKERACESGS